MSEFFDNFKKNMKEAAEITKDGLITAKDVVVEKAQEAGEYAKVSVEKSNLRNDIKKRFQELGEYFYNKGDIPEDAAAIAEEIKEKQLRLQEIEAMQKGDKQ